MKNLLMAIIKLLWEGEEQEDWNYCASDVQTRFNQTSGQRRYQQKAIIQWRNRFHH